MFPILNCSYHDDNSDMLEWDFYMIPELAARGVLLMNQFQNVDGSKKQNDDLNMPYPNLSKFKYIKGSKLCNIQKKN